MGSPLRLGLKSPRSPLPRDMANGMPCAPPPLLVRCSRTPGGGLPPTCTGADCGALNGMEVENGCAMKPVPCVSKPAPPLAHCRTWPSETRTSPSNCGVQSLRWRRWAALEVDPPGARCREGPQGLRLRGPPTLQVLLGLLSPPRCSVWKPPVPAAAKLVGWTCAKSSAATARMQFTGRLRVGLRTPADPDLVRPRCAAP
mmetsp:Transcript_706/g.2081  ORF Transcript_706/g.2081 Transcript_706/m.2081 type:complete len:200 (+) Transcript_706:394-993(+)